MSTFKDAIDDVLYRIDEDVADTDEEILQIVKQGLNEGYKVIAINVDKRTKDDTYAYEKFHTLPSDFLEVVNISHNTIGDLSIVDYEIKANILFIRAKDAQNGTITLKYSCCPTISTLNDGDTIQLKESNYDALIVYASYVYYIYRKKTEVANLFMSEFKMLTGIGGV